MATKGQLLWIKGGQHNTSLFSNSLSEQSAIYSIKRYNGIFFLDRERYNSLK